MCKSRITSKKFLRLLLEVEFYRIVFYLIFLLSGYEAFSFSSLVKAILPINSIATNFTGCYLVFFLCIPFLNCLVHHMSEKMHLRLLLLCTFAYVLFGTVPFLELQMNYVSWFIVLYLLASYIRLYPKALFDRTKVWASLTVISVLLCSASVIACTWLGARLEMQLSYYFVTDSNTLLAVITAISSFLLFKNLKIRYSKVINTVAASTFGVFLIHANSETMRRWLWGDVLKNTEAYHSSYLPLHAIGSVIAIFLICMVIDLLRIRLIERPFFAAFDTLWDKITLRFSKFEEKICSRLNIGND
jgi:hypothetical protein